MDSHEYEFDVAFSFLAKDEGVAMAIASHLEGRKVFIYSERQSELAGRDGEIRFKETFGEKSRLVVVLYRPDWGTTTWTRFEEEAIKNRAFDHGYSFTLFVAMETSNPAPKWLPRTQLWTNYQRFGVDGCAAIIDSKLNEMGLESQHLSPQYYARLRASDIAYKAERERFLANAGLQSLDKFKREFFEVVCQSLDNIKNENPSLEIGFKKLTNDINVAHPGNSLHVRLVKEYVNTLKGTKINISRWNGLPPGYRDVFQESRNIGSIDLVADMTRSCELGWIVPGSNQTLTGVNDVSDWVLNWWLKNK